MRDTCGTWEASLRSPVRFARTSSGLRSASEHADNHQVPSIYPWLRSQRQSKSVQKCSTYSVHVKPPSGAELPPSFRREMSRRLLEHAAERKQCLLIERPADQLQPERQPIAVEPGRNRDAGQARHVHGDGEHVVQIHLDRIAGRLLADAES